MKKYFITSTVVFFLLLGMDSFATTLYWYGHTNTTFGTASNWSISNSSYVVAAAAPTGTDVANFGNYSGMTTANCSITTSASFATLQLGAGYTGTLTQNSGAKITLSGTATFNAGTFTGGDSAISVAGAFSIGGGTFTSTTGTLSCSSNFTFTSGTFNNGGGTVAFNAGATVSITISKSPSGITFNNVSFLGGNIYNITTTTACTVSGTLTLGTGTANPVLNSGTINAKGNVSLVNTSSTSGSGGSATIIFNGSGTQSLIGSATTNAARICNIQISKSSSDTMKIIANITALGNWIYTGGIVKATGSSVTFFVTKRIAGSHTLDNVTFFSGSGSAVAVTIAAATTLTVKGTFTIGGTVALTIDSGTVNPQGNISVTNISTSTGGNGSVLIDGSANQSFTGVGTAGQGKLPNITINKSGGTLSLLSTISVTGGWTYTAGTIDAITNLSTVDFYGNMNLDGQGTSATMSFYDIATAANTITLTGNLNVGHNLAINSSTTLSAGGNSITVGANWNNGGTWTYGTSTVTFNGSGYNSISKTSGAETFYNLTFDRTTKSQTLLNPVKVNNVLTLTKGHVKTTATNYLELIDNATLSGGGIGAYVHGPMRKTGNDAFTFPLGDTTLTDSTAYHPLSITAPSVTTDQYEALYKASVQTSGSTLGSGLASISSCEYWTLERKIGTSSVTPKLGWNNNCDNGSFSEMHVASWDGSQWVDFGQASYAMTYPNGTVTASTALTFGTNPAPLTIGYASVNKSFATLGKTMDGGYYNVDGYVLYFSFDEEYKDVDAKLTFKVYKVSTDRVLSMISNPANNPADNYGDNRYKIDLYDSTNTALASGYYVLEVTNEKNEKWYLRFKI